jgi:hypothetical protein
MKMIMDFPQRHATFGKITHTCLNASRPRIVPWSPCPATTSVTANKEDDLGKSTNAPGPVNWPKARPGGNNVSSS